MGIGVQGEAGGEIAEHTADGFDVNTVLESDGGEGMAEIVEPALRNTCTLQNTLEHIDEIT